MKNDIAIAHKIKALKAGNPFTVKTTKDRQRVCRVAKVLRDAGVIDFIVVTRKQGGMFTVAAI